MDIKQAVGVVKQVVEMAQKGGLLTLQDAVITVQALQVLDASVAVTEEAPVAETSSAKEVKK